MAKLDHPTSARDRLWLRWQLDGFDELERPLAAVALIERLRPASPEERRQTLEVLREVGAIELLVRLDQEPDPVAARARGQNARLGRRGGDGSGADRTGRRPQPLRAGGGGAGARADRRPAGAAADSVSCSGLPAAFRPASSTTRSSRSALPPQPTFAGRAPFRARVGASCLLLRRRGGLRARTGARGADAAARRPGGAGAGCRRGSARAGRRRHAAGRSRTSLPRRGRDRARGRHPRARLSTTTRRRSSWR